MTLRRLAVFLLLLSGLAGCGPKPVPGGDAAASGLDGTWTITKAEGPPSSPAPPAEELAKFAVTVKGNLITARRQGESMSMHATFEIDTTVTPNVITLTQSDEKGDTSPVKYGTTHLGGKVSETTTPRAKLKGLISVDGDTVKLAICTAPDAPAPTEFAAKEPAKKWGDPGATAKDTAPTVVVHFTRVKEPPAWVNEPPPPRPATTYTGVRRDPPPTSAPKGK